jgi:hypothetical protein
MENTQLIIIVLGLLASGSLTAIVALAYFNKNLAEQALAIAGPALLALRERGEEMIVSSGVDLSLIHEALMLIKPYVDSPDDRVIQSVAGFLGVPVTAVASVAAKIWTEAEDLTDGEVEALSGA